MARISGYLDKIAYTEGELVEEGKVLFQIDPKPFQAQLQSARGELQAQQARHTTAAANLKRVKPLAEQRALPQADLDKAQGEFDASRAAVFSAQAKVKEQELNLGYATIRAPVTGMASRSLQREGTYLNAMADSAKLTYVAALDPMWVTFSMSQNQMGKLREMVEKKRTHPACRQAFRGRESCCPTATPYPKTGRVNFADPSFSQDTGSFMIRADIADPEKNLRPGMFVTAKGEGRHARERDHRAASWRCSRARPATWSTW